MRDAFMYFVLAHAWFCVSNSLISETIVFVPNSYCWFCHDTNMHTYTHSQTHIYIYVCIPMLILIPYVATSMISRHTTCSHSGIHIPQFFSKPFINLKWKNNTSLSNIFFLSLFFWLTKKNMQHFVEGERIDCSFLFPIDVLILLSFFSQSNPEIMQIRSIFFRNSRIGKCLHTHTSGCCPIYRFQ